MISFKSLWPYIVYDMILIQYPFISIQNLFYVASIVYLDL